MHPGAYDFGKFIDPTGPGDLGDVWCVPSAFREDSEFFVSRSEPYHPEIHSVPHPSLLDRLRAMVHLGHFEVWRTRWRPESIDDVLGFSFGAPRPRVEYPPGFIIVDDLCPPERIPRDGSPQNL